MTTSVIDAIEAILFDMNGTLRVRQAHEPTQRAAIARISQLLERPNFSDADWQRLTERYEAYRQWTQETLSQLSEEEIWTQWMLPDQPPEKIAPLAPELMLAWCERKGRTIPRPGAPETLAELQRRGYHLGVISNSMSSLDIPRSIEHFGWRGYFEVVILASGVKARKPAPGPYLEATRVLNVEPSVCANVGNRFHKDITGCKRAGFALGILIENPDQPQPDQSDKSSSPDMAIHSLVQLLDIFPRRMDTSKLQ